MVAYPKFKLLLVGDSGAGKTALMSSLSTGEFESQHNPTIGVSETTLWFWASKGTGLIRFDCLDVPGDEAFQGSRGEYLMQGDCAIILFDVTSLTSFRNVTKWLDAIVRVCGQIPIVLCGTKVDVDGRRTRVKHFNFGHKVVLPYFEVSAMKDPDLVLWKPFECLARTLLRDESIMFVEPAAMMCFLPAPISPEQMAQFNAVNTSALVPLPDEDEDL